MPTEKEEIKKIILDFFEKMGFDIEISSFEKQNSLISAKIKMEDPKVLIGKNGQILNDIQHILKLLLKRKIQEIFYLDIDINDYKRKKAEYLRELARETADEVSFTKKEKQLWPMPAFERRIIHLELVDRKDVLAKSVGEEPNRKIVIRPAG